MYSNLPKPRPGSILEWREAATSPMMLGLILSEHYGFRGFEGQRFIPYEHIIELNDCLTALCDGRLYASGPGPLPKVRATYRSLFPKNGVHERLETVHRDWYDTTDFDGKEIDPTQWILEEARPFNPSAINDELVYRLGVAMPIRHGKSLMCSMLLPVWYLIQNPYTSIIVVGHTAEFAHGALGRRVQSFLNKYAKILGLKAVDPKLGREMMNFESGTGIETGSSFIMFTGVDVGVLGNAKRLGVLDDPIKRLTDLQSEKFRDRQNAFYSGEWLGRVTPVPGAPPPADVIVFSRAGLEDIAGKYIIKSGTISGPRPRYYVLHRQALVKDTQTGEERSLCEPMVRKDTLLEIRELRPQTFQAQYQNDPRPIIGLGFPRMEEWPTYTVGVQETLESPCPLFTQGMKLYPDVRFATIDLSGKSTKRSDYTVVIIWDYNIEKNLLFVRHVKRMRIEAADHINEIKKACTSFESDMKVEYAVTESVALSYNLLQSAQRDPDYFGFDIWESNRPGGSVGARALSKTQRITRYADATREGMIILPQETYDLDWWIRWKEEHETWPNVAHDDQLDAASDAVFETKRIIDNHFEPVVEEELHPDFKYTYNTQEQQRLAKREDIEYNMGGGDHFSLLGW